MIILLLLIISIGNTTLRKWDWINNYFALPCTCLDNCCIYGSFILTNDDVMNTNFVQINGKLQGDSCSNYTINGIICYFDDSTSVQSTLTCPSMSWVWSISKDNNTGSVYWTDNDKCQGVWNVIDLSAGTVIMKYGSIGTIVLMILIMIFL